MRPRRGARRSVQTVDIPERVYRGAHYDDAFVKVWAKMAALDTDRNGEEHCYASVEYLAVACGLGVRSVERSLTQGRTPGPAGGEPEFATQRRTHTGGAGRTAIRQVRPVTYTERSVRVPVTLCEALTPRRLRAVLLARHAEADGHQLTAAELAGELFHHSGKSVGHPLSERTGRRLLDGLEADGWIVLGRRAGYQGRHEITHHDRPLRPVPDAPAPVSAPAPSPDNHGGSGAVNSGGSLAIEEYSQPLNDLVDAPGGSVRRRRSTGSYQPRSVDTAGNSHNYPVAPATFRPAAPPYGGPETGIPTSVWDVLAPVHDLLPGIRDFLVRRITVDVSRQLADGVLAEDLRDQIQHRRGRILTAEIRDPGRWILGVGLANWPSACGLADCTGGFMRHTGLPCKACADLPAGHRGRPPRTAAAARAIPLLECPGCNAPYRPPLRHPHCRICRTELPTTA